MRKTMDDSETTYKWVMYYDIKGVPSGFELMPEKVYSELKLVW